MITERITIKREYRTGARKDEMPLPKYKCASCSKRAGVFCSCFNRRIEPYYNKCFYHSQYTPFDVLFQAKKNLEDIIKEEQERLSA